MLKVIFCPANSQADNQRLRKIHLLSINSICYSFVIWNSVYSLTIVHKAEQRKIFLDLYAEYSHVYMVVHELTSYGQYIGQQWTTSNFLIKAVIKYSKLWTINTKILMKIKNNSRLSLYKNKQFGRKNCPSTNLNTIVSSIKTNSYKSKSSWTEENSSNKIP